MPDREKVIKGLEHCSKLDNNSVCTDKACPYYRMPLYCNHVLMQQAINVIKDQDKHIKTLEEKLRILKYGDQDAALGGLMPAT